MSNAVDLQPAMTNLMDMIIAHRAELARLLVADPHDFTGHQRLLAAIHSATCANDIIESAVARAAAAAQPPTARTPVQRAMAAVDADLTAAVGETG